MWKSCLRTGVLLAVGALAACSSPPPQMEKPSRPPGLYATPERLAFLCVTPGCDETQIVHVAVQGDRRVAIKRIFLEGDAQGDFSFTSAEPAPFIVGENAGFDLEVRYAPQGAPAPGAVELRATWTDASAEESEDRLEPGELAIPLVRRLVGEPIMTLEPTAVTFGVVRPGETKTLPLTVRNDGVGNIALELSAIESLHEEVTAPMPENPAMEPGASLEVPVTFAPVGEAYVQTEIVLHATAPDVVPGRVRVEGTSLTVPKIGVEPGGHIDFGEVARGKTRTLTAHVVNQGGMDLTIQSITVNDATGNIAVELPNAGGTLVLAPLERVALPILVTGQTAGEVGATVTFASDDPQTPTVDLRISGLVTRPVATLAPPSVDFGTVPVGWVLRKPVEIRNTGYGELTVKHVTLVSGSSNLFTLMELPALPLTLKRDQRIAVDVEFRAETQATFSGWLSVETDDPDNPFREVPLAATVGSCEQACPIANGEPTCSAGICAVGKCNAGWYDTDAQASNGCECKEIDTDPGSFCADSIYKGVLDDNDKDQTSHTGVLATEGDVDVIRFFARDSFALFDENFKVKVRLESADPTIKFCVYRTDTGSHQNECYWSNEVCPANRQYQRDGKGGSGDDADFVVKVYRDATAVPTCTPYTLFMSNGV